MKKAMVAAAFAATVLVTGAADAEAATKQMCANEIRTQYLAALDRIVAKNPRLAQSAETLKARFEANILPRLQKLYPC